MLPLKQGDGAVKEPEQKRKVTVDEYLAFEDNAKERHEFVDGQIYAMTGASNTHTVISLNIASALKSKLRGSGCTTYIIDTKVHVEERNSFYYPDVVVDCGKFAPDSNHADKPSLIFEVLSPSTAATDRREKRTAYQTIDSLQAYMIVHQTKRRLEIHQRDGNDWSKAEIVGDGRIRLAVGMPCELTLTLDEIYDGLDFEQTPPLQVQEAEEVYTW